MFSRKLVWQIYRAFLLIILIPALFFIWYTTHTFRTFFVERTISSLTERAYQLSSHMALMSLDGNAAAIDSLCKYLSMKIDTRFTIINAGGKVVGDSRKDPDDMENHTNRMEVIAAMNGKVGIAERYSNTLDERMLYVAVPVRREGVISGIVRAALAIDNIHHELRRMYLRMGIGYFIVAVLAAFVSYWISRRIGLPIEAMKLGAQRFAEGDFTGKLQPSGCEEIDQLSNVLNDMARHLRDTINRLKEQHNRLDAVLAGMAEGVVALDNDRHIITINNAAVMLLGLTGRPKDNAWLGEVFRNAHVNEFFDRIGREKEEAEDELTIQVSHTTGASIDRHLRLHGSVLKNASGETIGALVVMSDLTHLRKLETMRSDFVANVSHELRTPLTSVKGFVETLLAGAIDDKDASRHFLQIISRQVERLSTIVADLLALARIEQEGRTNSVELQNVKIADLIGRALESCNPKAAAKEIVLTVSVDRELCAALEPALIEEALINLIDNAVSYSPEKSTVTVSAGIPGDKLELVLSVADNGPGIGKEHHERIFERFYRVDKARSRKLGGTGLGLSIVKHIAIVHHGRVAVTSTPGEGSTFFMYLPFTTRKDKEQPS